MDNNPPAMATVRPIPSTPVLPLTSGDVAGIFGVTTTTVKRWADAGLLEFFRTPGGHYRFQPDEVERLKRTGFSRAHGAA